MFRIAAGWNFANTGTLTITVTDGGGTNAVNFTSGEYSHITLQDAVSYYSSESRFGAFATALQTALNALPGTQVYTVTFNATTGYYTVSVNTGTFSATLNAVARQILGFSGNWPAASTTVTGTVRPYYLLYAAYGARSLLREYEGSGIVESQIVGNRAYGIAESDMATYEDWTLEYETKAATHIRSASSTVPWTYQHFFQHCRSYVPFRATDDNGSSVHMLRSEGAKWDMDRATPDSDSHFHVPFKTYLLGRV